MRALVVVTALALASCSFTTASGFVECNTDADCGAGFACVKTYCLPLPDGCSRHAGVFNQANRIPLLAVQPMSSPQGDGGIVTDESEVQALRAMSLAVEEVNEREGLKGRKYGLFFCDSNDDKNRGAEQAGWLVKNVGVPAILSSGTGLTNTIATQADRVAAQAMIISPTATGTSLVSLFQSDKNVWRVAPDDSQQAKVLANEVAQATAGNVNLKVVIAHVHSDYGNDFQVALRGELTMRGRQVEAVQFSGGLNPTDALAVVNTIAAKSPVATVLIGFAPDVVSIITLASSNPTLRRSAGHLWFFSDSAKDPAILTPVTGPELEGRLGTAPAQGAGAAFGSFSDSFLVRYGIRPDSYSFTSHAFDAAWLTLVATAWAAQNNGGVTGARMREGMAQLSGTGTPTQLLDTNWSALSNAMLEGRAVNVEGSSGPLDFNLDTGTPSAPYEVWQVLDGGLSTVRLVTP